MQEKKTQKKTHVGSAYKTKGTGIGRQFLFKPSS